MSQLEALSPWQQRAYERAAAAMDAGRLGHALLICGPAHLGKRAVANHLAYRALCRTRDAQGEPCGTCRSCRLFVAGTHPDFSVVSFVMNKENTRLRTEVVIDQIRALSSSLSLTPQFGGAQVVIVDPADAVNAAALNALLKTLEEPQPNRYLWLVSSDPARLPATIRSRCQRLEFTLPPKEEALDWLQSQGYRPAVAAEALVAARGHPGLADAWLREGGLDVRREVIRDLESLASGGASAAAMGQRWAADEHATLRPRFAADHAVELATRLTDPVRTRTLATWFDAANRTRALLRTTVRADLAIAELLLAWPPVPGSAAGRQNMTKELR
jgi:DNA polymerase-3 subunit delta'